MPGLLEVEVDGSLFNAGGQLEDLVKAAQTYGQLRYHIVFFSITLLLQKAFDWVL